MNSARADFDRRLRDGGVAHGLNRPGAWGRSMRSTCSQGHDRRALAGSSRVVRPSGRASPREGLAAGQGDGGGDLLVRCVTGEV
jgi:hypothetical protein